MERDKVNIENTKITFELISNLKKLDPYTKNKKVIEWAKQDEKEMYMILKNLKENGKLKKAYELKEITNIKIYKKQNIEKRIIQIYNIINTELNSWRKINLEINI